MAYKVPFMPVEGGSLNGELLIFNVTSLKWEPTSRMLFDTGTGIFTIESLYVGGSLECPYNILLNGAAQIKFEITEADTTRRFAVDTSEDRIELLAGQLIKRTAVSSTPYAVAKVDYYLAVDTTAAITVNLPAANAATARTLIIKDVKGTGASTNAITITPNGADTCEVASIANTRDCVWLVSDGTSNWELVAKVP